MSRRRKSTIVRAQILHFFLRLAFTAASGISSELAACWLERVFLTPHRRRVTARERFWISGADSLKIPNGSRKLAAWSWGSGQRTALLVHGWGGRASQLGAFIAPLVSSGWRVVAFDAPGHGRSSGRQSSLVEMADAVADAARALGGVQAVIAHSAGTAATTLALRAGLATERLIYVSPPSDPGTYLYGIASLLGLEPAVAQRTQRRIESRFGVPWSTLRSPRIAPAMTTPLLVFHDTEDRQVGWKHGRELVRAWPGSRLVTTHGLGHGRILHDPDVVSTATHFLNARGEGGAPGEGSRE